MNIVLDTNVLVSAIWSPGRNASDILNAVFARKFTACYDHRILEEYDRVLHYKKFPFSEWEIHSVLHQILPCSPHNWKWKTLSSGTRNRHHVGFLPEISLTLIPTQP